MHVVRFSCGFGNQLFQLCLYEKLKEMHGTENVFADISYYDRHNEHGGFRLKPLCELNYIREIPKRCVPVRESDFFTEEYDEAHDYLYVGYWQDRCFFPDDPKALFGILRADGLSSENRVLLSRIEASESVSIHVRRGDYVNDRLRGNIATRTFFANAIRSMKEQTADPEFFVFSDDMAWCRKALDFETGKVTYVTGNEDRIESDMLLMSRCRHHIISNSSFGWWAQELDRRPDKIVISPEYWYNEPLEGRYMLNESTFRHVKNHGKAGDPRVEPFFSVLVTVPRREGPFRRCMSSLLDQPFDNIEVFLLQDPASEVLLPVVEEYASRDARIVPIAGGSLCSGRITALHLAKGNFCLFLYGIDYLAEDAFETLHSLLKETPADVLSHPYRYGSETDVSGSLPDKSTASLMKSVYGEYERAAWSRCYSHTLVRSVLNRAELSHAAGVPDLLLAKQLLSFAAESRHFDGVLCCEGWYPAGSEEAVSAKEYLRASVAFVRSKWKMLRKYASECTPGLLPLLQPGRKADTDRIYKTYLSLYCDRSVFRILARLLRLDIGLGTHYLPDTVKFFLRRAINVFRR